MKIMIGTNIKRLRTEKGVTQEQLAEAMNVTCAAVSKWERNDTYPDITLLQPLAFYFGVSLGVLMPSPWWRKGASWRSTSARKRISSSP